VRDDLPILYVIACGGRPAGDLPDFVTTVQADGWDVCVITSPSGRKFIDAELLADLTGHPVRDDYKRPEDPDVLPSADALAVVPATFNTINKWAHGISDTLALGLLNEAVGLARPIVAVPWPNVALARHPAFTRSITDLRSWGVTVLLDPDRLPAPDSGEPGKATFPWDDLHAELTAHHAVAEIGPARRRTGADLRAALDGTTPPEDRFTADIDSAVGLLTTEDRDPWADDASVSILPDQAAG
jgi:Flavoprotein